MSALEFYFIWVWFVIVIIFQDKTQNLQGIHPLSNFNIYSTMINKKMWHSLWQIAIHFIQKFICMKVILQQKDFQSLNRPMLLVPLSEFWLNMCCNFFSK
jgi:hypothetical protein